MHHQFGANLRLSQELLNDAGAPQSTSGKALRFPFGGQPPSIVVRRVSAVPVPSDGARTAHQCGSMRSGYAASAIKPGTIARAAADQLTVARSADWGNAPFAQAAWRRLEKLEDDLLKPASTVEDLAGKLTYLLCLSEASQTSWRYRLIESAVSDVRRLINADALSGTSKAGKKRRNAEALAREQEATIPRRYPTDRRTPAKPRIRDSSGGHSNPARGGNRIMPG